MKIDYTEKVYQIALILGVLFLLMSAISGYTLLMVLALLPIWFNAILLNKHRNKKAKGS